MYANVYGIGEILHTPTKTTIPIAFDQFGYRTVSNISLRQPMQSMCKISFKPIQPLPLGAYMKYAFS